MPKQPAFPGLRDAMKKKVTRREQFLTEMEAVVPWGRLLALIAPHYPKVGPKGGRPPMPLETMLRVYFLQNWYALSDPMAEEILYDSEAMRRFAGIELGDDRIPDETTILNFRHLLERHGLTEAIFADVNAHLRECLAQGRRFDAVVLDPPKFAPTAAQAERAARAYKDINRLALKLLRPGGLLFTFSCSGGIGPELFHKIVAGAGIDAGVDALILQRLAAASDHPTTLFFPESDYLTGLALLVR